MFGAIWALIAGGAIAKESINNSVKDFNSRYDSSSPFGTYYDHKGRQRLKSTNELVDVRKNGEGDLCVIAIPSGKVLRNITNEQWQAKKESLLQKYDDCHTTIVLPDNRCRIKGNKEIHSEEYEKIYEDLKTGQRYVARQFGEQWDRYLKKYVTDYYYTKVLDKELADKLGRLAFYMDIKTGMLVRVSDGYKRWFKKEEERKNRKKSDECLQTTWVNNQFTYDHAEVFIKNFNEWRKKEMKEMDIQNDLMDYLNFWMFNMKSDYMEEE